MPKSAISHPDRDAEIESHQALKHQAAGQRIKTRKDQGGGFGRRVEEYVEKD